MFQLKCSTAKLGRLNLENTVGWSTAFMFGWSSNSPKTKIVECLSTDLMSSAAARPRLPLARTKNCSSCPEPTARRQKHESLQRQTTSHTTIANHPPPWLLSLTSVICSLGSRRSCSKKEGFKTDCNSFANAPRQKLKIVIRTKTRQH